MLWRHGVRIDLGTFPEDSSSNAYYVNSRGQVVGTSEDRAHMLLGVGEHAFLWEDGGPMVNLNTLIPAGSSLALTYAVAINDDGVIAGFGVPPGVPPEDYEIQGHAYILIPCDEDHPGIKDCDYTMVDVAAAQSGVLAPRPSAVTQQTTSLPAQTGNSLRNRLMQRYRLPGQRPVPRG